MILIKTITALSLTVENFKEFGAIITNEDRQPDSSDENFGWWERLGVFNSVDPISINILEAKKRSFMVNKLEYHQKTPEAIIPLGDEEVILAVAPSGKLDEKKNKSF